MSKNSGLGKGLGSLIPRKFDKNVNKTIENNKEKVSKKDGIKITNTENMLPKGKQVLMLPVDKLKPNTYQPRTVFSHNEMEELITSIKEHGVLQPIMVNPAVRDMYEIIMGERRYRAAKMAGLEKVPVVVREKPLTEREKLELAIIENVQRKDLTPIEEAKSYQRLIDEFNLTQDMVAKKIGKSRSTIANFIRLLNLPQEIQDAIGDEKISLGHAKSLLSIDSPVKQLELYRKILINNLNVRDTERLSKKRTSSAVNDNDYINNLKFVEFEKNLRDHLHTKVHISKKANKGTIVIDFYSHEELENIINSIKKDSE